MKPRKNEKQQVTIFVLEESHQWVYIRTYRATRTKNAELYNKISRSPGSRGQPNKTFYQGKERSLWAEKEYFPVLLFCFICVVRKRKQKMEPEGRGKVSYGSLHSRWCQFGNLKSGLWNPELGSRNPKSHKLLYSGIQSCTSLFWEFRWWDGANWTPGLNRLKFHSQGIRNPRRGIQNPRVSCISFTAWGDKEGGVGPYDRKYVKCKNTYFLTEYTSRPQSRGPFRQCCWPKGSRPWRWEWM